MCFRALIFAAPKIWCFFKRQRHETWKHIQIVGKCGALNNCNIREILSTNGNDDGIYSRFERQAKGQVILGLTWSRSGSEVLCVILFGPDCTIITLYRLQSLTWRRKAFRTACDANKLIA